MKMKDRPAGGGHCADQCCDHVALESCNRSDLAKISCAVK